MFVAVIFVLRWGYVDALGSLPIVQFVGCRVAADLPLAVNGTPVGIAGHVEVTETAGQLVSLRTARPAGPAYRTALLASLFFKPALQA